MRRPSGWWLVVFAVVSAACTGLPNQRQVVGELAIGADLPLSGDDAPDGLPVEAAVEFAIKEAGPICGISHSNTCVRVHLVADDDVVKGVHDPAKGKQNVAQLAADPAVVGVIGPLYDSLAKTEIPAANAAGLALISPSNADECLTQEPVDGHCQGLRTRLRPRVPNTYFRVVTTQLVEGTAAADLAYTILGKRRAFVVNDETPFALAVATEFAQRFTRDRGTILDAGDLGGFDPARTPTLSGTVAQARALGADIVYFAGSDLLSAANLRRQMGIQIPEVALIGTDRLSSSLYATAVGPHVRGTYYTAVGVDPAHLKSAAPFVAGYRKATGQPLTGLALQGAVATDVLIQAIRRAIDDAGGNRPGRGQVLAEVAKTREVSTFMGVINLDSSGDTTLRLITAYEWLTAVEPSGQFAAQVTVR